MKRRQKNEIGAGVFIAVLGSVIVVASLFLGQEAQRFAHNASEVKATIVSVKRSSTRDSKGHSRTTYSPKLRFTTSSDQNIEEQASWYSRRGYHPGESLTILVDNSNPYLFKEKGFGSVWGLAAFLLFMGGGCTFVGITIAGSTIWKTRQRNANNAMQCTSLKLGH
jgi:hypothetical protein